jgi:acetyl-CoA carboxylase biotin carboxyl carrier protein
VRTIRDLVALMTRHDLSEIDLRKGDARIRLRRGQRVRTPPPVPVIAPAAAPPVARPAEVPVERSAASPAPPTRNLVDIKSPTVGTFYAQPNPDAPPYVTTGSRVTPTTVVCMIEAMKIFNEIQAECGGVVAEVLVKNKEPVEYGTVLFRVDPNG